tara:strand:- start:1186 stop:2121 length:936 start_codon:yes stop_codon:yes gene_type:complete
MSGTYLNLTNLVLARINEVQLTSANFTSARGIQTQAQNAVNESIRYINQREFNYPFNHATATQTLTAGVVRYSLPSSTKNIDYNTFRLVKDSDLGASGGRLSIVTYNDYINSYITQEDEINSTTAAEAIDSSETEIDLTSASAFDSSGTVYIDNEQISYTGISTNTLTGCTRGASSTTAASHDNGVTVTQFSGGGIPRYVIRSSDNNYLLYPFPTKSYSIKFDYYTFPSDLSAHGDTTSIPSRFDPVIVDGATAFIYQYRGETAQYQLNFARFEQGIKNMQTLLINKFEYLRSTFIPRSGNTFADLNIRVS